MKGDRALREQRSEDGNQVADNIEHFLGHFEDRFTLDNPRLVERYLKGELLVLVDFVVRAANVKAMACFQREEVIGGAQGQVHGREQLLCRLPHSPHQFRTDAYAFEGRACGQDQAMLVDTVQAMKLPKRIVPSLVWLDSVDRINGLLPHALYLSRLSGFVFRGGVKNWEVNMEERPWLSRTDQHKLICQMVKGAPEVLNNIPDDEGDVRRDILDASKVVDWPACLGVALYSDFVGVFTEEGFESAFQIVDVLIGPCDFRPNAYEAVSHEYP